MASTAGAAAADDAPVPVPEPSPAAMEYYRGGNVLWIVYRLMGLAVPAAVLVTGLSSRLRDAARRIGRRWFFILAVYFILYTLIGFAACLPLNYYAEFVRPHAYGLSNQTFAKWLADSLVELGVAIAGGCLFLWTPYLLLRLSPQRWWLYTGFLSLPFLVFVILVYPVWIDPLYSDFGPMNDKRLEAKILALAERAGIEGSRVYEVNKSVDTKTLNAYVTGFLGTKRIVVWDTLLAAMDDDEVLAVMAHEMGHYVLDHIAWGILAGFAAALVSLYAVHRLAAAAMSRFGRRFGFDRLSDVASLPLLALLLNLVALVLTPAELAVSRAMERQADVFSLELTENNRAAATAFVKLQVGNLSNPRPGPLYVFWRSTHPTLAERIERANTYRPWKTGDPLRYKGRFTPRK